MRASLSASSVRQRALRHLVRVGLRVRVRVRVGLGLGLGLGLALPLPLPLPLTEGVRKRRRCGEQQSLGHGQRGLARGERGAAGQPSAGPLEAPQP